MNGIKFVFNNQTVLIQLFFVITLCGFELCSFNKILHCMQIPLIVWLTGMKYVSCDVLQSFHSFMDVSLLLCLFLGFALGFVFEL